MKNRLFVGLLFLTTVARTQVAVTNSGVLYIKTNSDIFYSAGDFTNTSSASLTINGLLYLKGNVSNNAFINIGTGTVFLNGTTLQTISGTQPFNVYNLNTNNAAGIQLNANLSVSGVHTFSSGVITTSATPNYIVYESGASYTGASDAKHVNGWIKKIGSTNFIFPTGNGVYLREIELRNLSGVLNFNAKYNGPTFNPLSVLFPVASVNPGEHWTINQVTAGNAQVKLNWDSSKVPFPNYVVPDLRAVFYSGTQWTNVGGTATGSVATTGTITSNSLASFGRFAIGSISFPLPLKFVSFSAVKENSAVKLKWQTANEEGVRNYEVQKSVEGGAFVTIATVNAANNDYQLYQFLDASVLSSKNYYRIKAIDFDGKAIFTKVIIVTTDNIQKIQLANNPVKDVMQLITQNISKSVYSYQLINSAGQLCKKGSFNCEGSTLISIPVGFVSAGHYNLLITNGSEQRQFALLIQ